MGSSFHYNILAGMKGVDAWQRNIMRNAQGLLLPGFNKTTLSFGATPGAQASGNLAPTGASGGRSGRYAGGDSLTVSTGGIHFEQGSLDPAGSPTSLAVSGPGFFLVAESLKPGARLFLTRNGDFRYDPQGRLVNGQGLFVVGGGGNVGDPPQPVMNPGNGSVVLPSLTLANVKSPQSLAISGYGPLIYEATVSSGPVEPFPNGSPAVGFVQPNTLENPNIIGQLGELQVETSQAQQTYKMFKDMLENFNRSTDDAINVVK